MFFALLFLYCAKIFHFIMNVCMPAISLNADFLDEGAVFRLVADIHFNAYSHPNKLRMNSKRMPFAV